MSPREKNGEFDCRVRFGFLSRVFPKNESSCVCTSLSFRRFHNKRVNSVGQNPTALVWRWRQVQTFEIKMSTLNAPISPNKVSIFEVTIED